jgi:hypothetical protein
LQRVDRFLSQRLWQRWATPQHASRYQLQIR